MPFTADRLYPALFEALKTNAYEFSKKVGIGKGAISNAITRKSAITAGTRQLIVRTFPQVSPEWLKTGEGEMFITQEVGIEGQITTSVTPDDLAKLIVDALGASLTVSAVPEQLQNVFENIKKSVISQIDIDRGKLEPPIIYTKSEIENIITKSIQEALQSLKTN